MDMDALTANLEENAIPGDIIHMTVDDYDGTIKYYRAPYTMKQNIEAAVKLYSGDKPLGMFVVKLDKNLQNMNSTFELIKNIFEQAGIYDFEKLPSDVAEKKEFAKRFNEFNRYLEAAKVQGFTWNKLTYSFVDDETGETYEVTLSLDETKYKILALRYKELFVSVDDPGKEDNPYDLNGHITTIPTDDINSEYMNSRFIKFLKALNEGDVSEKEKAREELHKTFASLTQEEQKFANIFLHDLETGDVTYDAGKSIRDYINEYMNTAKNDQIHHFACALGLDENILHELIALKLDETTINEFGRLDHLKDTVDIQKATEYLEKIEGHKLPLPKINMKINKLLRDFVIKGGFEIS